MKVPVNSIAGAVVLYHPSSAALQAVLSYLDQVERLYVIDNSPQPNSHVVGRLTSFDKVHYVSNNENKGIAAALNMAAQLAIRDRFRFLLTMDQDTVLPAGFVAKLGDAFSIESGQEVGIAAPRYPGNKSSLQKRYESVLYTLTSGNILNLQAFSTIGPFREELFIDHVDHEYCLRLHDHGYAVIQDNSSRIEHVPGNLRAFRIFGKTFSFSSHSPARLYYFCRNGLYVSKLYGRKFPRFKRQIRTLILKEVAKIPLEKEKLLRIRMLQRAYRDYKANRMGPIK